MNKSIILIITIMASVLTTLAQDPCVSCLNPTSVTIGPNNNASGSGSIALGSDAHTTLNGTNTIAIGGMVKSDGPYSFVLGTGGQPLNGKRLINSYPETLMIGFNSTKPTLFVSTSETNFDFDKTGKIGIGNVTDPQAKLHLRADEEEVAAVFIEPNIWDPKALAHLWLGNQSHGITANYLSGLSFHTQSFYLFNDGNVGIGTTSPQSKLHVAGTIALNSIIEFKTPEAQIIWGRDKMLFKGYKEDTDTLHKGDDIPVPVMGGLYTIMELDSRTGYVGVNTTGPKYNLQVTGSLFTNRFTLFNNQSPPQEGSVLQCDKEGNAYWGIPTASAGLWKINPNNNIDLYFTDGNVGIGTIDTYGYALAVAGKIISTEVTVKEYANWPDFVFEDNYQLKSLASLENYINTNNHLPGVPTAKEVQNEGVKLGEMNAILLQKVEELTLYLIEQEKIIEKQGEILEIQQNNIEELAKKNQ